MSILFALSGLMCTLKVPMHQGISNCEFLALGILLGILAHIRYREGRF